MKGYSTVFPTVIKALHRSQVPKSVALPEAPSLESSFAPVGGPKPSAPPPAVPGAGPHVPAPATTEASGYYWPVLSLL